MLDDGLIVRQTRPANKWKRALALSKEESQRCVISEEDLERYRKYLCFTAFPPEY